METALFIALPLLATLGLGWLALHARRVHAFERAVLESECRVCGCSFSDTLPTYLGRPTRAELARLDAFQKRFARYRVYCNNCSSICICTRDGAVMKGLVVRDD